jgi:hypothetical protein
VTAILPLHLSTGEIYYTILVPLLFSIAIPLTNLDRITTKKKYQAFLLSSLLTIVIFFCTIPLGLLLGQFWLGQYSIYALCTLLSLSALIINSIFIRVDNIKIGLLITGLISLSIPAFTYFLKGHRIIGIDLFNDPATVFIIWESIIGFAIALSIWTKINKSTTMLANGQTNASP